MFWNRFVSECNKIHKSPSSVAEELGFNRSACTNWKKGGMPHCASLEKIADYFNISADYFREIDPEDLPSEEAVALALGFKNPLTTLFTLMADMSPEDLNELTKFAEFIVSKR